LNKRQDFLISNTICWFKTLEKAAFKPNSKKDQAKKDFVNKINDELVTILPKTMKTGIEITQNEKSKKKKSSGISLPNFKKAKKTNFQDYTRDKDS
jgi:hypothetical protein